MLSGLGFTSDVAGSASEALGKLRSAGGRFDCVLLSDALPAANLGAVVAELHAVRNDLPVLIVHARDVTALKAELSGVHCVGFIAEGSDVIMLRRQLESVKVRCTAA